MEDNEHLAGLHLIVLDDAASIVDRAFQLKILGSLIEHGETCFHDGIDIGKAPRTEEHFAHTQRRVASSAIDVYQLILLDGFHHQVCCTAYILGLF